MPVDFAGLGRVAFFEVRWVVLDGVDLGGVLLDWVALRDAAFLAPGEYMAKKIPGARLEVIPGAGHASNLDRPDVFSRVLRDFLSRLAL